MERQSLLLPHAVRHPELVLLHWKPLQLELPKFWQVFEEPTQRGGGVNVPLLQFGSPQVVIALWNASAGHVAAPVQASATSQLPAEARHTVFTGESTSPGQEDEEPLQTSGGSQAPALARQLVVPPRKTSAGQVTEVPLQTS